MESQPTCGCRPCPLNSRPESLPLAASPEAYSPAHSRRMGRRVAHDSPGWSLRARPGNGAAPGAQGKSRNAQAGPPSEYKRPGAGLPGSTSLGFGVMGFVSRGASGGRSRAARLAGSPEITGFHKAPSAPPLGRPCTIPKAAPCSADTYARRTHTRSYPNTSPPRMRRHPRSDTQRHTGGSSS